MVFVRSKLPVFVGVYLFVPMVFLYGFRVAFSDMPAIFFVTGFLVNTAFMCTFYPAAFDGYSRMYMTRQYDAILSAAVPLWRIMLEDTLWFTLRGLMAAVVMGVVSIPLTLPVGEWWQLLAALPLIGLVGLTAALFGMLTCALCRDFDQITYAESIVAAIFVFSGVFVQISMFPLLIQTFMWFSPLFHGVEGVREIIGGGFAHPLMLLGNIATLMAMSLLLFFVNYKLLYRRLLA